MTSLAARVEANKAVLDMTSQGLIGPSGSPEARGYSQLSFSGRRVEAQGSVLIIGRSTAYHLERRIVLPEMNWLATTMEAVKKKKKQFHKQLLIKHQQLAILIFHWPNPAKILMIGITNRKMVR